MGLNKQGKKWIANNQISQKDWIFTVAGCIKHKLFTEYNQILDQRFDFYKKIDAEEKKKTGRSLPVFAGGRSPATASVAGEGFGKDKRLELEDGNWEMDRVERSEMAGNVVCVNPNSTVSFLKLFPF